MIFFKYLILFLIFFQISFSSEINLTQQEKDWIKNNPTVTLGADNNWPPFDFLDKDKKHSGLSSEYLKLISKKTGLNFNIKADVWSNTLKLAKEKKLDGLTCAVKTQDREKYLNFTTSYLDVPMAIITRVNNNDIKGIDDLKNKTVSINKGSYVHEWLQKYYPDIKLNLTSSNEKSIEAVSFNKADAYIGNIAVATYIINKNLLNDLKITSKFNNFTTSLSIAIDKDQSILFSIVQKAINSIDKYEHQQIKSIWQKQLNLQKKINFTTEEEEWIKKHQSIKYTGDPDWLPFEAVNKYGKHIGIAAEYIDKIQAYTGINFKYIPSSTWLDAIEKTNNSKVNMIVETTESKLDLYYTKPFISNSVVIVMKKDNIYVDDLKNIYDKKIAIIKEYGYVQKLKKTYKDINFYEVENIKEGLSDVSTGKYDALLCTSSLASYSISEMGLHNVHIVGKTTVSTNIGFGLSKEYKPLVDIIDKVLNHIDEKDKHDILKKWTYQTYIEKIDYTMLWQITGVFVFFIMGTVYWNRKLSKEIQKRKTAQNALFKANKELRIATESANAANKAKTDFLSNMSHEIRTPMNAILGFTELLDESIEDKRLKSYIKTIRTSGQTLLYLINDILDLSKIESGKLQIINLPVDLKNLFEDTIELFKLKAEEKSLELILNLDSKLPKSLLLDSHRLKEILINLIGNALKFTEEGYIKVNVSIGEVFEHNSKINITIEVEDSGIGIAKKDQENIFNIFEQTENQDIKKYGGTGLGLAISRKLAHLMDGSLNVESELGKGAKFIVNLNNIDIASISEGELNNEKIDYKSLVFKNASIMVVDDILENRELIKESIKADNIKLYEAANGKEAIKIAKETKLDLIFMDIRMPEINGYTATKEIRKFSSTPIVALTASIMQDELDQLNHNNFNGYLRKPVSKSDLYKSISAHIEYTNNKKTENQEVLKIEKEDIDNLEPILEYFDEINTLYDNARLTNDMQNIEKFANYILDISKKHNIQSIMKVSNLFLESIDSFDIDKINFLLNDFTKHIKELKALKEKT